MTTQELIDTAQIAATTESNPALAMLLDMLAERLIQLVGE